MGLLTDSGLLQHLANNEIIADIKVTENPGLRFESIQQWERDRMILLPSDMKDFYSSVDGFSVTWCVKFNSAKLPLGRICVNALKSLQKLELSAVNGDVPSFADLDDDVDAKSNTLHGDGVFMTPLFGSKDCQLYEIDYCGNNERVCMVNFKSCNTCNFWFLDRSFRWHFLAHSFTDYLRLMVANYGLPKWQYLSTDAGLPSNLKLWYAYFLPSRLQLHEKMRKQAANRQLPVGVAPSAHEHVVDVNFIESLLNSSKKEQLKTAKPTPSDANTAKVKAKSAKS